MDLDPAARRVGDHPLAAVDRGDHAWAGERCGWRGRSAHSSLRRRSASSSSAALSIALTAPPASGCGAAGRRGRRGPPRRSCTAASRGTRSRPRGRSARARSPRRPERAGAHQPAGAGRLLLADRVDEQVAAEADAEPARTSPRTPSPPRRPSCRRSRGRTPGRRGARRPNGSVVHASRGSAETTSTWPQGRSVRPPPAPGKRATSCGRPAKSNPSGTYGWPATSAGSGSPSATSAPWLAEQLREVALERGELPAGLHGVEADERWSSSASSSSRSAMCVRDAALELVDITAGGAVEARATSSGATRTRPRPRGRAADRLGEHPGRGGRDVGHAPLDRRERRRDDAGDRVAVVAGDGDVAGDGEPVRGGRRVDAAGDRVREAEDGGRPRIGAQQRRRPPPPRRRSSGGR